MSAVSIIVCGNAVIRVVGEIGRCVDSNLDPCEQAIVEVISEVNVLREGVVGTVGLFDAPHVLGIGSHILGVGVVGIGILNGGAEHFVPEKLADVGDAAGANLESLVGEKGCIQVGKKVSVRRTAFVVAGEDAFKGGHTVTVSLLNTTQVGRVPAVGSIVA